MASAVGGAQANAGGGEAGGEEGEFAGHGVPFSLMLLHLRNTGATRKRFAIEKRFSRTGHQTYPDRFLLIALQTDSRRTCPGEIAEPAF